MEIHYGPETITVGIPASNLAFDLYPQKFSAHVDPAESIFTALADPIGSPPLKQIVRPTDQVVILADDMTRLTPSAVIIPFILNELNAAGIPDERIKVIVAGGSHRHMTVEEKVRKFGPEVMRRVPIRDHDYLHEDHLLDYGVTSRGTRIWVNKEAMEADIRIAVGVIFPHFPAGWGGGAKMMLPGIAGDATTAQMHLLGVTDPTVQLGMIDTTTRQEMEDFAARMGLHFIVNVVLDGEGRVAGTFAGGFVQAHRAGVAFARQIYEAPFDETADLVLVSTYPIDKDYFQCMKGLYAADLTVKDGGEVILISPIYEGMAPTHREALRLEGLTIPQALACMEAGEYEDYIGVAIGMYQIRMCDRFRITAVSEGLSADEALALGVTLVSDSARLPQLVAQRLAAHPETRVGVLHQATEMLPRLVG